MIIVDQTEHGVRITLPTGAMPPERLNAFIEWLRFEEAASQIYLSEPDADRMAEAAKAAWWSANKSRFIAQNERPAL